VTETLRILRIAAGGDGVGRLADGRTVFIPRTAPGDLIEPADIRLHARFARARLGSLVEWGPGRVHPRCAHYRDDDCGGCQLQHLDQGSQHAARRAITGDALRRIAKLSLEDPELEPTPAEWNYRSRITLAVDTAKRVAGFHRVGDAEAVFPLVRCEIADERLNTAWLAVASARDQWPAALSHIVLRLGRDDRVHVVFRGPARPAPAWGERADLEAWWEAPDAAPRRVGRGSDDAGQIPPGVFEQVHQAMGERIRAFAVDQLGPVNGQLVWDLYAGIGETSSALAARGAVVESVELDPEAVATAKRDDERGIMRHAGTVEGWVDRLSPPVAVMTNPPRAGMSESVVRTLASRRPERIVYISCDPATLARDLARLGPGYRVTTLRCFDLFPQTAHVETVVRMDRV
jgi:23S rRNA (uracil1939-C5)-methyltransferase